MLRKIEITIDLNGSKGHFIIPLVENGMVNLYQASTSRSIVGEKSTTDEEDEEDPSIP